MIVRINLVDTKSYTVEIDADESMSREQIIDMAYGKYMAGEFESHGHDEELEYFTEEYEEL